MKISRRSFVSGILPLALIGCGRYEPIRCENLLLPKNEFRESVSYKLEDLCDTKTDLKKINLFVYIKDSELLWEYHQYKKEIFGYVRDFFRENNIDVNVSYLDTKLKKFNDPTEFGIEIYDSKRGKEERFYQLKFGLDDVPNNLRLDLINTSHAVTPAQIVLTNGIRKSSGGLDINQINELIKDCYIINPEYILKSHASHFSHEILHLMSLFHVDSFDPDPISKDEVPNIMRTSNGYIIASRYYDKNVLGFKIDDLQKKLIHSYVAGNNAYRAFENSDKIMKIYNFKLASGNEFELVK